MNKDEPLTTEELIKAQFGAGIGSHHMMLTLKQIRDLPEVKGNSR